MGDSQPGAQETSSRAALDWQIAERLAEQQGSVRHLDMQRIPRIPRTGSTWTKRLARALSAELAVIRRAP